MLLCCNFHCTHALFQEAQDKTKPRVSIAPSDLLVSDVTADLPSEAEEALYRQHAASLESQEREQREELEALEEQIGVEMEQMEKEEEGRMQELAQTNAQVVNTTNIWEVGYLKPGIVFQSLDTK